MDARVVLHALAVLLAAGPLGAAENLALGRNCTFSRPANYRYCADPDDRKQLTDGVYAPTEGQLWVKRECVGWSLGVGSVYATGKADRSYTAFRGEQVMSWPAFEEMQKQQQQQLKQQNRK